MHKSLAVSPVHTESRHNLHAMVLHTRAERHKQIPRDKRARGCWKCLCRVWNSFHSWLCKHTKKRRRAPYRKLGKAEQLWAPPRRRTYPTHPPHTGHKSPNSMNEEYRTVTRATGVCDELLNPSGMWTGQHHLPNKLQKFWV